MSKQAVRKEIDKAIANLMKYAEREPWVDRQEFFFDNAVSQVAERVEVSFDELLMVIEQNGLMPMAYGFLFEVFASSYWDNDEHTLIGDYLKRRGWREGGFGRQYLNELNQSLVGLWEVLAVKPGFSVTVQSLDGRGESFKVAERLGSQNLQKWDCIAARILSSGNHHKFSGVILPLQREQAEAITEMMGKVHQYAVDDIQEMLQQENEPNLSEEMIQREAQEEINNAAMADIIFQFWAVEVYRRVTAPPPTIFNKDNELFEPIRVNFTFEPDQHAEISRRLNAAPDLDITGEHTWCWLSSDVASLSEADATVWAHILLEDSTLRLEVNSQKRADKGKTYFFKLLDGLVKPGLSVHEDMKQAIETPKTPISPKATPIDAPDIIKQFMDQHYHKVLDENVPALDGRTPRECAQNAELHALLIPWLKSIENTSLKSGQLPDYDFRWIWQELKLEYPD